jgi:hypothetical protein
MRVLSPHGKVSSRSSLSAWATSWTHCRSLQSAWSGCGRTPPLLCRGTTTKAWRNWTTIRPCIAPVYWPLTYWTHRVLDGLDDIQAWPKVWAAPAGLDAFTLHHSGLTREDEYILTIPSASGNFLSLGTPFGLFGHTHVQACFFQSKDGVEMFLPCAQALPVSAEREWTPMPLDTWIPLPGRGSKALINPGSV